MVRPRVLHRVILSVALMALLGLATALFAGREEADPLGQVAALLPADGAAQLQLCGAPLREGAPARTFATLREDPESRRWLAPLLDGMADLERRVRDQLQEWGGLTLEELGGALRCRSVITLVGPPPGEVVREGRSFPAPVPELILLLDYRNDMPAIRRLLEWLEDVILLGGETTSAVLEGMAVKRFVALGPPYVEFYYAFQGPLLIAGTDAASFARVLRRLKGVRDGGSLARDPEWRQARRAIGAADEIVSFHADLPRLAGLWLGLDTQRTRRFLEAAGFGGLEAVGYTLSLAGGGFCERLLIPAPTGARATAAVEEERTGARALVAVEGERELLRFRAPLPLIFDVAWGWQLRVDPLAGLQRQWRLRSFERTAGFSVAGDLLPRLGPNVAIVADASRAGGAAIGMRVEVREAQRLADMLARGTEGLGWVVDAISLPDGSGAWTGRRRDASTGIFWSFAGEQLLVAPSLEELAALRRRDVSWGEVTVDAGSPAPLLHVESDLASLLVTLARAPATGWGALLPPLVWEGVDLREAPSEDLLRRCLGRIEVEARWHGESLAVEVLSMTGTVIWAALGFGAARLGE